MLVQNICSPDAYNMLTTYHNAFLVDVRTKEEWKGVGIPKLDNKEVIFLSWQLSEDFKDKLLSIIDDKMSSRIFFLCRSGYRSLMAANFIASVGYKNCYNIIDGFEGNLQNKGWKQNNLPWQF